LPGGLSANVTRIQSGAVWRLVARRSPYSYGTQVVSQAVNRDPSITDGGKKRGGWIEDDGGDVF
jgi:hypothetical protein